VHGTVLLLTNCFLFTTGIRTLGLRTSAVWLAFPSDSWASCYMRST